MILAILQARVSSTRLPGKVLKPILDKPMLELQIERIKRSRLIDKLILATSNESSDDPLEDLAKKLNINYYRGSLDDVLSRFYKAAIPYKPDHIVRLTGDCPLADPELIDEVIADHIAQNVDYTSNSLKPSYPDGLDIEVTKFSALMEAYNEAKLPSEREHVTPFIHKQPNRFKVNVISCPHDYSSLRWTVDEPEDFELVKQIYESLYPLKSDFTWQDTLELVLKHPELKVLNKGFDRNEGYKKSLLKDQESKDK